MDARRTALLAALAAACASPLDLPPEPESGDAPHITRIIPDVAIASLGSPLMVRGEHLGSATDVYVGSLHFSGGEITVKPQEIVVHVTHDKLEAAKLLDADGSPLPVRVVSPQGTDTALDTVRVYADLATITELAPVDVAPRQLVYLRGRGFDGDDLANNVVALSKTEGVDCAAPPNGEAPSPPASECVRAKVFWAARGLVIAEVPDDAPSGPVKVIYRNRQFEKLEAAALAWSAAGNDMAGFYESAPTGAPPATGDAQTDALAMADMATTTNQEADVPERAVVWLDPGIVTIGKYGTGEVYIRAEGRLCYQVAYQTLSPRLRVLVDGQPVPHAGISCGEDDNSLHLGLPAPLGAGQHAVQVVNPYFQSPVSFFTLGG